MQPRVFAPAILSGLLLWACFFPLDLGPLAFVALVPWLSLVRAEGVSNRRRYMAAFVGALVFFGLALQWIRIASTPMIASWIFLAVYCSGLYVLALFILRRLDRFLGLPLAFTVPVVFVALDYFRTHFPTGFPFMHWFGAYQLFGFGWYMLGYTQHATLPLLQLADVGGVYLVTFLVCAFNGATAEWIFRWPPVRRWLHWSVDPRIGFFREMWVSSLATVALMLGFGYGTMRMQHPTFDDGPTVAAVQRNFPQDIKMGDEDKLLKEYREASQDASKRADLVVWPETCFPYKFWTAAAGEHTPESERLAYERRLSDFAILAEENRRRHVFLGLVRIERRGGKLWQYNSTVLLDPAGKVVDHYEKIHLVPMGEYVPLRETFPWLQAFTPYDNDYSCEPGERYTRFPLQVRDKKYTFGCLICYEDSDPYLARQYVRSEPVDFLINISNDGWFKGWEEHEQHLAICRFRAVEARRSVVRAVNMGISAFIDPDGRIQALPGDSWRKSKNMDGTCTDKVKIDRRESLYAKYGDWLPAGCWAFLIFMDLASRILYWRRRRAGK